MAFGGLYSLQLQGKFFLYARFEVVAVNFSCLLRSDSISFGKSSQSIDRNLIVQNYSPNDIAHIPEDLNPQFYILIPLNFLWTYLSKYDFSAF